jgi:hypothetical protein
MSNKSASMAELVQFMNGPDKPTLRRLRSYFSCEEKYLGPRELKEFWDSLSRGERDHYRRLVETQVI